MSLKPLVRPFKEASSLLRQLLRRLEAPFEGIDSISWDEINSWPENTFPLFSSLGLLRPDSLASLIPCPNCEDGHFTTVEMLSSSIPGNSARLFVVCDHLGKIERIFISEEILKRWKIDLGSLALGLSKLFETEGEAQEQVNGRIWSLGIREFSGSRHEVLLIRGLAWPDFREIYSSLPKGLPLLLLATGEIQGDFADTVLPLEKALILSEDAFKMDLSLLEESVFQRIVKSDFPSNFFKKEGDFWLICYQGKKFQIRHSKGLQYLAYLLRHPQRAVHVLDLQSDRNSAEEPSRAIDTRSEGLNSDAFSSLGYRLDPKSKREYQSRLAELREELEEASQMNDLGRRENVLSEMEALTTQLQNRFTIQAPEIEKVRQAVSKAIDRSLKAIEKCNPNLAAHLKASLRLGVSCIYQPEEKILWNI